MPPRTLNCAASDDLTVGGNIVTGDVGVADNVTTGDVSMAAGLTSGTCSLCTGGSRAGVFTIGNNADTGDIDLKTLGDVNLGSASGTAAQGMTNIANGFDFTNRGTVTQATSETTGVTLNKPAGQIIGYSGTLEENLLYSYTFTNSYITANSLIFCQIEGEDDTGPNTMLQVNVDNIASGSCTITVGNPWDADWGGSYKIHFMIIG